MHARSAMVRILAPARPRRANSSTPDSLPWAAALHAAVYRAGRFQCVAHETSPAVLAVSALGRRLRPYLDDLAQIAGADVLCVPAEPGRPVRPGGPLRLHRAAETGRSRQAVGRAGDPLPQQGMDKEQILRAAARLTGEGLIERTWGNISARLSETQFLITPSGLAYERKGLPSSIRSRTRASQTSSRAWAAAKASSMSRPRHRAPWLRRRKARQSGQAASYRGDDRRRPLPFRPCVCGLRSPGGPAMTAAETQVREQILRAAARLTGEGLIERTWGNSRPRRGPASPAGDG